MVYVSWFIVYNEDEDEFYLWNRKRAYRPKITLKDLEATLPKGGRSILDYSPEELSFLASQVPARKKAGRGVLWKQVLQSKGGIAKDQIEHIEALEAYSGALKVEAFVGWSAYPGIKSWPK